MLAAAAARVVFSSYGVVRTGVGGAKTADVVTLLFYETNSLNYGSHNK